MDTNNTGTWNGSFTLEGNPSVFDLTGVTEPTLAGVIAAEARAGSEEMTLDAIANGEATITLHRGTETVTIAATFDPEED